MFTLKKKNLTLFCAFFWFTLKKLGIIIFLSLPCTFYADLLENIWPVIERLIVDHTHPAVHYSRLEV